MRPEKAGALLRQLDYTLATAESLTGGMVGVQITSVAGASDYYLGGVIAYAPRIKAALLSVPLPVLETNGVVSEETAAAMAAGVRDLLGSAVGLATTGVAGPDPLDGQPPGTLCVAVADPFGTQTRKLSMEGPGKGDRGSVVEWAASEAIALLISRLEQRRAKLSC